jgi:hypothetical protein
MKKYINVILILSSIVVLFYITYNQHQQIEIYKVQNIDSIQVELFRAQNEVGRYEMALEHLKEIDSADYNEIIDYIDNETE